MGITIHLPVGVVAAVITAAEYILSTIAALSARATLHGFWLLGLHRGGEATLDAQARNRRALRKDFVGFILTIVLVIAAALVETSLAPTWTLEPYAKNSTNCVSVFGKFLPLRVQAHSPPFRVAVEPWVLAAAEQLQCSKGIASIGVGSWTHASGIKMDMTGPTCVNNSLDLSGGLVAARMTRMEFGGWNFNPIIGQSASYTLFPLKDIRLGKNNKEIGTALEGTGPCGERGISGYFMGMNAHYETVRMHASVISYGVHESLCKAHGPNPVNSLRAAQVGACMRGRSMSLDVPCFRDSASPQETYSVRLPEIATLFVGEKLEDPSYACVTSTVQVEYIFIDPAIASQLMPPDTPNENQANRIIRPTLPVLVPTVVQVVSGTCERTIAPIAQSALFFSTEQEWLKLEFIEVDRQVRFHAYMMAVSESLFPLPKLKKPESSVYNGTCYVRPCQQVTEIPWSAGFIFLVVWVILVAVVMMSACIFRVCFRGESWLVGSARWSLTRLLGDGGGEGQADKETLIEAVPISLASVGQIPPEGGPQSRDPKSDFKYEYRVRTKGPKASTQVRSAKSLGDSSQGSPSKR